MDAEKKDNQETTDHPSPVTEKQTAPEVDEHPAPGVKHEPEPDAENIMPAEDQPGTL